MLRDFLSKHNVDSVQELTKKLFNKFHKESVPDGYVKEVSTKKTLNPRLFEFKDLFESNRLADILPYEWFDEETNIYQTNRAFGFIFNCGTLVGTQQNLDEQLNGLFSLGIPDGTGMQILLLASSDIEDKLNYYVFQHNTPILAKIAMERTKFYKTGVRKSLQEGYKLPVRDFKLVISFAFEGIYDEENKLSLLSLQQSISSILRNAGVYNELMEPNTFINLLREILCNSTQGFAKHHYDKRLSIRDQVAEIDNNIYIDADGICINDIGLKSIAVGRYPNEYSITVEDKFVGDFFSMASQIPYPFFITQNVTFLNQSKENAKLQTMALKTAEQAKPGKIPAYFAITQKKNAEYKLLQHAISNGEGLMLMNHMIHVYHPLGESEKAFQEIKSLYKSFGFDMVPNSNLQLSALLCSLPLFHDPYSALEQKRIRMINLYTQTNVVNMMPLFADYKGTGQPVLMLLSPRGQVMFFDIFQSETNYNVAISASSGSGKSFFTNEIVKSYRSLDAKISIIDVGRSYKNICELLEGQYIEFTKEAALCMNPFSFIKMKGDINIDFSKITKEELLLLEDLDDQITMLKLIFLVSAGITEDDANYQLYDSYLEQAILKSFQQHQNNSTYTTVYNELINVANEDNNIIAKNLADSIQSYTVHGIFGKYFEGSSNLNIDSNLLVLELEELESKGNLKFIALLILMLKITQDMYLASREQKKICIIDEAWSLMSGGNTGKFIEAGYRRARKYNGSFITITQSIDDYAKNTTTKACYENAAIKIMLKQNLPKSFELDAYTKRLLQNVKTEAGVYSELVIAMDNIKALCRFIVDDFTKLLYSTKAEDISLLKKIKEFEKLDTLPALEKLIHIRQTYATNYKRPPSLVSSELLQYLLNNSYQSLLMELGI